MDDFTGMTDLQFKSHLRLLIAALERAENTDTLDKELEKITALKKLFQEDIES